MLNKFINDEAGFIVSAELVLILTLMFCAVGVGVATIRDSIAAELSDVAEAVGALNQSYNFGSLNAEGHASCSGSGFNDLSDVCDCDGITITPLVAGQIKNGGVTTNLDGQDSTP